MEDRRGSGLGAQAAAFLLALLLTSTALAGKYTPAAGQEGSNAVSMDDPAFTGWASGWTGLVYGEYVDAGWKTPEKALGPAAGDSFDIVCLGRGGRIDLTFFPNVIKNREGWDFAVFENSISDIFLELAYVEVSSNGQTFVRFDTDSLTPAPVQGYGTLDPTDVTGFAGKHRQGFGTPFDLDDLSDKPEVLSGALDLNAVSHVRIVDVIGDGSCLDTSGDPVYDPYPTSGSAGFDLDAVGIAHAAPALDLDGGGGLDAADAVQALQTLTGLFPGRIPDMDGDGKGGLHEVLMILLEAARPDAD